MDSKNTRFPKHGVQRLLSAAKFQTYSIDLSTSSSTSTPKMTLYIAGRGFFGGRSIYTQCARHSSLRDSWCERYVWDQFAIWQRQASIIKVTLFKSSHFWHSYHCLREKRPCLYMQIFRGPLPFWRLILKTTIILWTTATTLESKLHNSLL